MTSAPAAKPRDKLARRAEVVRTQWLTPHMIRVVLGGEGLAGFHVGEFTDHYVKLLFPPAGAPYTAPFEVDEIRVEHMREHWPVTRTYTVRNWDHAAGELTIDFVYHGKKGLAGPWAKAARSGDQISFFGPGGAYAPDTSADWHLLVGDESALPAIAVAMERMPPNVPVRAFIEVEDEQEEQELTSPGQLDITWIHRASSPLPPGEQLSHVVAQAEHLRGAVHAFVHGDAGFVRAIRRQLRFDRGVSPEQLSVSGYWRRGRTEEDWRAEKPAWKAAVKQDEQVGAAG